MDYYLWVKVLHILAVISWMAGLLYLPRLMVYHADKAVGSELDATFQIMERRLLKGIMRPASLVAVLSGLWLLMYGGFGFAQGWVHLKLTGVLGILAVHFVLERHVRQFASGWRGRKPGYFRILNEVPTVLMIVIVIAVVVKPFA